MISVGIDSTCSLPWIGIVKTISQQTRIDLLVHRGRDGQVYGTGVSTWDGHGNVPYVTHNDSSCREIVAPVFVILHQTMRHSLRG